MALLKGNKIIAGEVEKAENFVSRLRGLIGRKNFGEGRVLFIPGCNFIHTFFMRFRIDIVMTDNKGKVVFIKTGVKPFRITGCPAAKNTIELKAGTVKKYSISPGDNLSFD